MAVLGGVLLFRGVEVYGLTCVLGDLLWDGRPGDLEGGMTGADGGEATILCPTRNAPS